MSPPSLSSLFQIGIDVLNSVVSAKTKSIQVLTGDNKTSADAPGANAVDWWQHVGFSSRPPNPIAGKSACQVVIIRRSDNDAAIASHDLRGLSLEDLAPGETMIYAPGSTGSGTARVYLAGDGTIRAQSALGTIKIGSDGITATDPAGDSLSLNASTATLTGVATANVKAPMVNLGAAAIGGVATQVTMAPLLLSWTAATAALNAFFLDPVAMGILGAAPTFAAVGPALTALSAAIAIPANFSLTVKASS